MHSALKFYFTGDGEGKALATSPLTLAVGPQETSRMSWQTINQVRLHLYGLLPFISISLTSQGCTEVIDRTGRCCWLLHARKLGSPRKEMKGPNTVIEYSNHGPAASPGILQSPSHITAVPFQLPNTLLINVLRHPYSMALRTCQPTPPPLSSKPKFQTHPRPPSDSSRML
jgi:hypothetical protein